MATKRFNQAAFDQAMNELFNKAEDFDMREIIADYVFDFDKWDDETPIVPCIFTENGMYTVLYNLCNYDIIRVNDDGTVDTEDSNDNEIAKLVAPYITKKNGKRLVENLYEPIREEFGSYYERF